jgi:hypothetical protein
MGGKSQPAPDYSGMEAVAREQLNFSRQQYADILPIAQEVAGLQIDAQRQQMDFAAEDRARLTGLFRPLEDQFVAEAQAFNTDARRQELAGQAAAASASAFANTQAQQRRGLAAMGVNPASGAARGADRSALLQQSAQRAAAMTGARSSARQEGRALQAAAIGMGNPLATGALQAYAGATGAGSAGLGSMQSPGQNYMKGLGMAGQTYGNMANMQNQAFMQGQANEAGMWGSLVGAGATLGGAAIMASDRRLKENILAVGEYEELDLTKYQFNYIGDERVFIGVMADEVMELYPEAVIEMDNGYFAVDYESLGIEMEEIGFTEGDA